MSSQQEVPETRRQEVLEVLQRATPVTRRQHVLEVLRYFQPATVADLAAYHPLAMDEQAVRNHLSALKSEGLVRTVTGSRPRRFEVTR